MPTSTDFTFRTEQSGKMALSGDKEHIVNVLQMLFHLVPGTDDYLPDLGLDIRSKAFQPHVEGHRDNSYESKISEQLSAYTDLTPMEVMATYMNNRLNVYLRVRYNNNDYTIGIGRGSDSRSVDTIINISQGGNMPNG